MSSYTRQQLETWLKGIKISNGAILDVGGSQNPLNGRLGQFAPTQYQILDLEVPHQLKEEPNIIGDIQD